MPLRTAAANKEVFRRLGERGPVTQHRIGPVIGISAGRACGTPVLPVDLHKQ